MFHMSRVVNQKFQRQTDIFEQKKMFSIYLNLTELDTKLMYVCLVFS